MSGVSGENDLRRPSKVVKRQSVGGRSFRKVYVCDEAQNGPSNFCSNDIRTSKYTVYNFVFKNLWVQFQKLANVYFLFAGVLECIPQVTMTNGVPTYAMPLMMVLGVTAIKDALEDYARHKADGEENNRITQTFKRDKDAFVDSKWTEVKVGDIVRLKNRDMVPADMVMIDCSVDSGLMYSMTANLDGETNLKLRKVHAEVKLSSKATSLKSACRNLFAFIDCQQPNGDIEKYDASFTRTDKDGNMCGERTVSLSRENVFLRGCQLRNTAWAVGVVLATGRDTKIQQNFADPPFKVSTMMKYFNYIVLALFGIMVVVCGVSTTMTVVYMGQDSVQSASYLWGGSFGEVNIAEEALWRFFTFVLLFAQFVPISLYVTLDVVKFVQALIIAHDVELYHEESDTPAIVKSLDLTEELGLVGHVFSDKTGTLTKNEMNFMKCSVGGVSYGLGVTEVGKNVLLRKGLPLPMAPDADPKHPPAKNVSFVDPAIWKALEDTAHPNHANLSKFFLSLALNHDVMPEYPDPDDPSVVLYSATSPDEGALVSAARHFGFFFYNRNLESVSLLVKGEKKVHRILHTLAFTSKRKRSSVVVENEDGTISLYCKGADNVITARLRPSAGPDEKKMRSTTMVDLDQFAADGLRTLLIATASIDRSVYDQWVVRYEKARASLIDRDSKIEALQDELEVNLELLGTTGVEDKLQDNVPDALRSLRAAGIVVWVLTGDKVETAVNIGHASSLLTTEMTLQYYTTGPECKELSRGYDETVLRKRLEAHILEEKESVNDVYGVVVDTTVLASLFEFGLTDLFLQLAENATSLICARVSPSQKADVVRMMRAKHTDVVTLAIGDGANDVPMIQAAHVGIGISGNEGLQAVNASDFAIARFRFLKRLLLVHGRLNARRVGNTGPYMFYKNILQTLPQFYFGFVSLFSGQNFYYELLFQAYNVVHTGITIMAFGAFDKDTRPDTAMSYPSMYQEGIKGIFFSKTTCVWWILESIVHSLVCYSVCASTYTVSQLENGMDTNIWHFGSLIHLMIVLTANMRIAIMTRDFTWIVALTHFLCTVGWVLLFWIFCAEFWEVPSMYAIFTTMFRMPNTYLTIVLCLSTNVLISFLPFAYTIVMKPLPSTICTEIEHGLGGIRGNQVAPSSFVDPNVINTVQKQSQKRIKRTKSATEKRSAKEHIVQMVMSLFRHYDEDRSGAIGPEELKSILIDGGAANGHGILEEELTIFLGEMSDNAQAREVSKLAFSAYATELAMKSSFDLADFRRKGRLHDAFATVITNARDKLESRVLELQQIFEFYDDTGQGEINREKFGHMLADITSGDTDAGDLKITEADVDLFVQALDADGDRMIGQTEFTDYMLRGMAMTPDEREKFARRSQMHAKLNRFVENILWRLEAEEL